MSALGQKRTLVRVHMLSALPLTALAVIKTASQQQSRQP
jgi:hypothetical protein